MVRFGVSPNGPVSHHRPAILSYRLAAVCFGWLVACDAHGGAVLSQRRWRVARQGMLPTEKRRRLELAFAYVQAGRVSALLSSCAAGLDVTWLLGQATLTSTAATHGQVRCLQWLIATGLTDPEATDSFGRTPAHLAAAGGHLEVVATLVRASTKKGRERGQSYRSTLRKLGDAVNAVDLVGRSLLHYTCSDIERSRTTATTGAAAAAAAAATVATTVVTAPDDSDVDNVSGPLLVTSSGQRKRRQTALKLVSWLCRQGADVMHVDESGTFPLQVAFQQVRLAGSNGTFKYQPSGAVDVVEFLLGRMIKQERQLKTTLHKLVKQQREMEAKNVRLAKYRSTNRGRLEWTDWNFGRTTRWRVDAHRPYLADRTKPLEGGTGLWSTTPEHQRWNPNGGGGGVDGAGGGATHTSVDGLEQNVADTKKLLRKSNALRRLVTAMHAVDESAMMWWLYDLDGDGTLSVEELKKALTKWGRVKAGADDAMAAHILANFDFDGSGLMERDEFLAFVDKLPPPIAKVRLADLGFSLRPSLQQGLPRPQTRPMATQYQVAHPSTHAHFRHTRTNSSGCGRRGPWRRSTSVKSSCNFEIRSGTWTTTRIAGGKASQSMHTRARRTPRSLSTSQPPRWTLWAGRLTAGGLQRTLVGVRSQRMARARLASATTCGHTDITSGMGRLAIGARPRWRGRRGYTARFSTACSSTRRRPATARW